METLLLIAAYDQLSAELDELRSQMAHVVEVLIVSPGQHARIVKDYRVIEATINSINELLAFKRI